MRHVRHHLPSGLRAVLVPLPKLHSVMISVYARSGPRFEPLRHNGISHFIEHLLFRGSERYPDPAALSHAVDALGADLNGATYPEYTEIALSLHYKHLEAGLQILGQLVAHPRFEPADIEKEHRVILQEMAHLQDAEGSSLNLDEMAYRLMWPRQTFSFRTIGSRRALGRITRRTILEHYRRTFAPRNFVVCMAGRFEEPRAVRLIRQHFDGLKRASPLQEPPVLDRQDRPRLLICKHPSPIAHIRLCHKACSYRDPRLVKVLVLCDILGGGTSSRLFMKLREERSLVYDVGASPMMFSDVGAVEIATSCTRGRVAATIKALLRELELFLKEGVTEQELRTVKQRVANHMELMMDNPGDLVEWFGVRELLTSPRQLIAPQDQVRAVLATTPESLLEVARDIFRPEGRNLLIFGTVEPEQRRQIRALLRTRCGSRRPAAKR